MVWHGATKAVPCRGSWDISQYFFKLRTSEMGLPSFWGQVSVRVITSHFLESRVVRPNPSNPSPRGPRARQHNITVVSKSVSGLTLFMSRPIIIHRTVTSLAWSFTRGPLLLVCSWASSMRDFELLGKKTKDTRDQWWIEVLRES